MGLQTVRKQGRDENTILLHKVVVKKDWKTTLHPGADLGGCTGCTCTPPQENINEYPFIIILYLHVVLTVGVPVCDVGNRTSNIEMLLSLVVRASSCEYNKLASQV